MTLRGDAEKIRNALKLYDFAERVELINMVRSIIAEASPFKSEPVDLVLWKKVEHVTANDYNPNRVAPPELKLLQRSILEDGYTMPCVTCNNKDTTYTVVDGFHRLKVAKDFKPVNRRLEGYIPITCINPDNSGRADRQASTIRHNLARGQHTIKGMQGITAELVLAGHSDQFIAEKLGMDKDELLRFRQTAGLPGLFNDSEYTTTKEDL